MLRSAVEHYRVMQRLAVLAVRQARRARTISELAAIVVTYQTAAARQGAESVPDMLAEQDVPTTAQAAVAATAFSGTGSDGQPLAPLLRAVTGPDVPETSLVRLIIGLVTDAGRNGQLVATVARPQVTGHTRYVNPPCCGRCAILAGRWYRWSDGFLRHPRCDCVMVPCGQDAAPGLVSDPLELFRDGQIRGLSEADTAAVDAGADLGQVVNVRRKKAGMSRAGRVHERGGRLTPEGILALASDRAEAIGLLRRFRYLT